MVASNMLLLSDINVSGADNRNIMNIMTIPGPLYPVHSRSHLLNNATPHTPVSVYISVINVQTAVCGRTLGQSPQVGQVKANFNFRQSAAFRFEALLLGFCDILASTI
jgi:hypothetical protein